jgi:hypothetical protein
MAGPTLSIELDGPVSDAVLAELHEMLARVSGHVVDVPRRGYFDLLVTPGRLGITTIDREGDRPLLVIVCGPGFGDEAIFESEHADEPDPLPLIGYVPTHAVGVLAMCNGHVDHLVTAELTAAAMDIVGGVATVELRDHQMETVQSLPGLRASISEPWATAYGSAEFLRAWAAHPDFRLVK